MTARDGDPPRTFFLNPPLPNHLIHHGGWGGAILCVSLRRSDIPIPAPPGGMYDPSQEMKRG